MSEQGESRGAVESPAVTAGEASSQAAEVAGSAFETLEREVDADAGAPGFPRLAEAYRRDGQPDRAEEIAVAGLAEAPERLGGKVALALAMLDQGELEEARAALSGILEDVPEVVVAAEAPEAVVETATRVPAEASTEPDTARLQPQDEASEHHLYAPPLAEPSDVLPRFDGAAAEAEAPSHDLREDEIEDAFATAQTRAEDGPSANELAAAAVRGIEATTTDSSDLAGYRASEHPVFATETMASLLEGQGDVAGADEVRASMEVELDAPSEEEAPEAAVAEPLDAASAPHPDDETTATEAAGPRGEERERRERVRARLEGWLDNLGRDPA